MTKQRSKPAQQRPNLPFVWGLRNYEGIKSAAGGETFVNEIFLYSLSDPLNL